jgi:multiple sugar transport system ATP-binding protein
MTPRLELRELHKRFEDVVAVRALSMKLQKGEFVSLLGPSGCGKSTTLAMIAGFETPTTGEILVDGTVVNHVPPQRRRIGLVFQDYAVFSRMTVRANLSFGLEARRIPADERRKRVAAMAEKLQLSHVLERRGHNLNMSEMQRVALGRVLLTEPELILLDEPMSNLDAVFRANLRSELKQIQRELAQTVLYVTHDQAEAMSMSDRIAIMRAGEVQQIGTPDEIYDHPRNRFVAEFIGDPPINILAGEISIEGGKAVASTARQRGIVLGRGPAAAGRCLLAIRPHDIRVSHAPATDSTPASVRFVENLGAEHVLHLDYAGDMLRAVTAPGFAAEDDTVHLSLPGDQIHLIDRASEEVVPLARGESGQ